MNLAELVYHTAAVLIELYAQKYAQQDFAATLAATESEFGVPRIRTYDYIVVGGGTAGCVVASRLSAHFNVLLLEAGGNPVPSSQPPAYMNPMYSGVAISDKYDSIPDPNTGKVYTVGLGKMLGGCGSHNGVVHNRGSPHDFDNWANLTYDESWAYASVLQYFKKMENFTGSLYEPGTGDQYGDDGPLIITTDTPPILPYWLAAGLELGYKTGDPNGNQTESFHPYHVAIRNGRRSSTYTEYIKPYENVRQNLTVIRYADVQQVLIHNYNDNHGRPPKAYGVQYVRHGFTQRAYASREVIVSGGTFRSPLLLLKSGIGPQEILADAGIPVQVNRPGVGHNFIDHVGTNLGLITVNESSLLPRIRDGDEILLENYIATGEGVLGGITAGPQAMLRSTRAKSDNPQFVWPDLYMGFDQGPNGLRPNTLTPEVVSVFVRLGRPKSVGRITLNATAYRAGERHDTKLAIIDYNFWSDPTDVDAMYDGVRYGLSIIEDTHAFQGLNATLSTVPWPACSQHEFRSEAYWKCYIRDTAAPQIHPVGTCRMGQVDEPMAVVDSKLRVIGVDGLRVVDASVMPVITNTNINAPVVMIAEKVAHEIVNGF